MKLEDFGLSRADIQFLMQFISGFEGIRLKPYLCSAGVPTIGVGHTGPDVTLMSPPITMEEAMRLFEKDLVIFVSGVLKYSPRLKQNRNQLFAIVSWAFNFGLARYKTSTLRKRVDSNDTQGVVENIVKWIYAAGVKSKGLIRRRSAEAFLYQELIKWN